MSTSYYMMAGLREQIPKYELFAVSGSTFLDWNLNQLKKLNINWQYKNESTQKTQFGQSQWTGFKDIDLADDKFLVLEFGSNEMIAMSKLQTDERQQYLNSYKEIVEDFLRHHYLKKVIWILPIQIRDEMILIQLQNEFRHLIFDFVKRYDQFVVIDSWQCVDKNQNPILANHQDLVHVTRPLSEQWGQFLAKKIEQSLFRN